MLKGELRKFARLPSLWVLGGLVALVTLYLCNGATVTVNAGLWPPSLLGYRGSVSDALVDFSLLLASLTGTVIGSIVSGTEFAWGSWPLVLTQGEPRHRILATKLLVIVLLVAAVVLLVVLTALGLSAATPHVGLSQPLGTVTNLVAQCGIALSAATIWALIAAAVSLLARSTAVSLIVVGAYAVGEYVLELSNTLRPGLLTWNTRSLVSQLGGPIAGLRIPSTTWTYPPIWSTVLLFVGVAGAAVAVVLSASPTDSWAWHWPRASAQKRRASGGSPSPEGGD
jgi:hypothetical protein